MAILPANPASDVEPTALEHLQTNGYVILPSLLSKERVETIRGELAPYLTHFGRNPFEGRKTQRV